MGVELDSGAVLWRVPLRTAAKRHAATPLVVGEAVLVNSHTFGLIRTDISQAGNRWLAQERWANRNLKINLATPVLVGSHLYSHGPNRNFVCINSATGKVQWEQSGFGREHSAVLAAGDRLLVLTDEGELLLVQADPERYRELGRLQVCGRTWSSPAYANGKLFVRDSRELICLDLSALAAGLD
jgi:outer membrane protein assembly factor BamB